MKKIHNARDVVRGKLRHGLKDNELLSKVIFEILKEPFVKTTIKQWSRKTNRTEKDIREEAKI